ncbi:isochorismatase family protein [Massilia oculi]|uniref:isochorismatase family protein n=1 Tax=Massilia oculi TaxID=945844 RepID=UPI001AAFCBC3|nr:isochorismatase family protein [Massilia oculi]
MSAIVLGQGDALLIVDLQVDFLPGGNLGVPHGDQVIAPINRLIGLYRARALPIYASRDWHPELHCSFAAQGGPWPPHCVAGTEGAGFSSELNLPDDVIVVSKADTVEVDAYSAFNGTGLGQAMRARGIRRVAVCGLATDYCVLNTVLDGLEEKIEILIVAEAARAVDVHPGDGDRAMTRMLRAGAEPVRLSGDGLVADVELGARL